MIVEDAWHTDHDRSHGESVAFEERIRTRIRAFDLGALMRALAHCGYGFSDVVFESNAEESSPESFIEAIRFRQTPRRTAIVTLNMGLLGSQGLLPSYFRRVIEQGDDPDRFYDFIRFFDDRLLHDFIRALYPERDRAVYADWNLARRHYLRVVGLASTDMLHRLLRDVFPELSVRVRRLRVRTKMDTPSVRTGTSLLDGSAVLGGRYAVEPAGLLVDLVSEDGVTECGKRWPIVAIERLYDSVFPLVAPDRIALSIRFTTIAHANWMRVEEMPERSTSELGFDRVRSAEEAQHTVLLFEGIP